MSGRIKTRAAADADVNHYFLYIADDSIDAALNFAAAVEATYDTIADWPGIGRLRETPLTAGRGIRSVAVERFPNHLVFYKQSDDETIVILRIIHGAMDIDAISMDDHE